MSRSKRDDPEYQRFFEEGYESPEADPWYREQVKKFYESRGETPMAPDEGGQVDLERVRKHHTEQGNRAAQEESRFFEQLYRAWGARRPSEEGTWRFVDIPNASGGISGWKVELNGRNVGTVVLSGNDLHVITGGDVNPTDIMAALLKLYPNGYK
jgi:hypothetical protein